MKKNNQINAYGNNSFFGKYKDIPSELVIRGENEKNDYTFLIPAYRNPFCLDRALNSIYLQIDCPAFSVVVVDDSGEDITGMIDVIKKYAKNGNLSYYKNKERLGLFGNWNRCYELSRTKYCCFLNHDDELKPNYLNRVSTIMNELDYDSLRVGHTIIHGGKITSQSGILNKNYLNRPGHIQEPTFRYFLYRAGFPPSGTCIKREVVYSLGGFNEKYYPAGDYEFDARLTKYYKVGILWERLCNIYTDVSTSMQKETIIESARISYPLNLHVYNEIYNKEGKYNWIAAIKYWIAVDGIGFDFDDGIVDRKYSSFFWKSIYRMYVDFMRVVELLR